jgi:hypothetical protein
VHLAVFEDLVAALEADHAGRRGPLGAAGLSGFLGRWYLRQAFGRRRMRGFAAATVVLGSWMTRASPSRRRRLLRREVRRTARAVGRAARATELLEALQAAGGGATMEDCCEVIARGVSHVVLRPLAAGGLVGPVEFPPVVAARLDPGTLAELRLGRRAGRWRLLGGGTCYPAASRPALVEARLAEVEA